MTDRIHIGYVVLRMDVGGVERSICRLLNGLPRDQYRFTVICLDRTGNAMQWVENKSVEVIELHKTRGWDFRAIREMSKVIGSHKIDILQSHNWGTLVETVWANRSNAKSHIHAERGTVLGPVSKSRIKTLLKSKMMRYALNRVDIVMSNSFATADKVRVAVAKHNLPVEIIPNGLNNPYTEDPDVDSAWESIRQRTRSELGVGRSDLLIGAVGRLNPVKNFEMAIRGFASFIQEKRYCRENSLLSAEREDGNPPNRSWLLFVGDGPSNESLRSLACDLGVSDCVLFVGEKKDAWPYYAAMDIFLSTSHSEGMSQSILEAMSSGKAIVATDVGDAKRMLDFGRCGRLIDAGATDSLTSSISELASNQTVRVEMGGAAHSYYLKNYSLDSMLSSFDRMYRELHRKSRK